MDDLGTLFQQEGLARVAHDIVQVAQPSIRLLSTAMGDHVVALGVSKLGGLPDLPEDMAWPIWKGVPLAFIAQINLAEVHAFDTSSLLPAFGLLSFFYDADHVPVGYDPTWRGGWRVLYTEGERLRLRRTPLPPALLAKEPTWLPPGQQYSECALRFTLEVTLPPADSISLERFHLSSQEREAYWKVLDALKQRTSGPLHRLLGYPDALQGDMQVESQLVSHGLYLGNGWPKDSARVEQLLPGAQDWQLLLQLDTDYEAKMLWGIEGRGYYWIQTKALQERRFENTWFIMQWT